MQYVPLLKSVTAETFIKWNDLKFFAIITILNICLHAFKRIYFVTQFVAENDSLPIALTVSEIIMYAQVDVYACTHAARTVCRNIGTAETTVKQSKAKQKKFRRRRRPKPLCPPN